MLHFKNLKIDFVILMAVFLIVYVYAKNPITQNYGQNFAIESESENPYNPGQYGVPDVLGGYKVLAIFTHEDNPCMSPQTKNIILQTVENTAQEYLQQTKPITDIQDYLHGLPGEANTVWQISMVGPGLTIEKLITNATSLKASMSNEPCPPPTGKLDTASIATHK